MNAVPTKYFLDDSDFSKMLNNYKKEKPGTFCDYSDEGQMKLAEERLTFLKQITEKTTFNNICEIGPGTGALLTKIVGDCNCYGTGVDIEEKVKFKHKSARIITSGVHIMDEIENESIDLLYSFDAFEHIHNVKDAFFNCLHKLAPGGNMFIKVGPTYYTPWGFHYYHITRIPYVHVLFNEKLLTNYSEQIGIPVPWTNRVPAISYFEILNELPFNIKLLNFWYDFNWYNSDIIIKNPHVFKSKHINFENFFITSIYFLVKKETNTNYFRR